MTNLNLIVIKKNNKKKILYAYMVFFISKSEKIFLREPN